ncbi:unnamed protein product [Soboliphyme baturini]|uniref:Uncharacterized protein n=1 Tax=Soboliphyme baturini TaxID=241478 RepID=A0A183J3U2_9BILA|nr:unnamed protein product [Soboliphyme baturini]
MNKSITVEQTINPTHPRSCYCDHMANECKASKLQIGMATLHSLKTSFVVWLKKLQPDTHSMKPDARRRV